MIIFPISRPGLGGFVDRVEIEPAGLVRILGWYEGTFDEARAPQVLLDGRVVPRLHVYRFLRTDMGPGQAGLALEYLLPEAMVGDFRVMEIDFGWEGEGPTKFEADLRFIEPHHRALMDAGEVQHKEHIYGPGPPNTSIHPEVWELAKRLKGPVLDFGCGRGLMVRQLRALGIDAHGIELDTDTIRDCLTDDLTGHITLYDGTFPTLLESGKYASVICSEVLEHIPNYERAVREIARLAKETALFTVPDASAIPIGYRHGAVPWHLLEGSHVNFFTQQSLAKLLAPHFTHIEFGRVGGAMFGDSTYYVSLSALCGRGTDSEPGR
jgi:SAM-dependent methyltransferase